LALCCQGVLSDLGVIERRKCCFLLPSSCLHADRCADVYVTLFRVLLFCYAPDRITLTPNKAAQKASRPSATSNRAKNSAGVSCRARQNSKTARAGSFQTKMTPTNRFPHHCFAARKPERGDTLNDCFIDSFFHSSTKETIFILLFHLVAKLH
jgi:hypothetical protein